MASKTKAKPTFKVKVRHGTPHHMEDDNEYSQPGQAIKFLLNRVAIHHEWAKRYNGRCAAELEKIRVNISGLDPRGMHVGEVRTWEAMDDHSRVVFRFEIELVSR